MSAGLRATERRPVRVTIEGEAYRPSGGDTVQIIVRRDGGKIVLPDSAEGVTVEDITPPLVWTDGDVVQEVEGDRVWRRVLLEDGRHQWSNGFWAFRSDSTVSARVTRGDDRVLRYQRGDDA